MVVLREHLDQNRSLRREVVLRRQRLERVLRERHRVLAHHRRLFRVQLEDDVPLADHDELVERVEERQEVVGDDIVRVEAPRPVERLARLRLVARAHEVHTQIGVRAGAGRIERHRFPREPNRIVETVVPGGELPGRAVDLAEGRVDLERPLHFRVEAGTVAADVRDGGRQRTRVEMGRVLLEDALDPGARGVVAGVVELELGQEELRVGQERVDFERLGRGGGGRRRIVLAQRSREPGERRGPVRILRQRLLKRLHRLRAVVLFEEEHAPGGVDRGVGPCRGRRTEQAVGFARAAERRGSPPRAEERGGVPLGLPEQHRQRLRRGGRVAEALLQQCQRQRRVAEGRAAGGGPKRRDGLRVLAFFDREVRDDRKGRGIVSRSRAGERFRFRGLAMRNRAPRAGRERQRRGLLSVRRQVHSRPDAERQKNDGRQTERIGPHVPESIIEHALRLIRLMTCTCSADLQVGSMVGLA